MSSQDQKHGGYAQKLFVMRVTDRAGRKLVKFSWGRDEIIMKQDVAERVAKFILYEDNVAMLGFESPVAKAAMAVERAISEETITAIHTLERACK